MISYLEAFNLEGAIRGMRNPYKNTEKSDSFVCKECCGGLCEFSLPGRNCYVEEFKNRFVIGPKDLDLAQRLILAGSPHDKFMRQIFVSMDIKTTLAHWKEFDTYKIGTVANSESTMHTITKKDFTFNDFAYTDFSEKAMDSIIKDLNLLRKKYLLTTNIEDKKQFWRAIIDILPSSYYQTRTWTANYAVLRNIVQQRKGHRLEEWHHFIDAIKDLPYSQELIFLEGK